MTDALLLAIMGLSLAAMYMLLKGGFKQSAPPPGKPVGAAYLPSAPAAPAAHWSDGGRLQTEVVAESRYQDTVRKLAGAHGDGAADTRLPAVLAVDMHNPYDDQPVAVFVAGEMTGYLGTKDAAAFRTRLERDGLTGQAISCDAAIRGGALWQDGKRFTYAVWLDIDPAQ